MANTGGNGAARFTSRYTDAQKDAILRSVVLDRRTVKDTIALAEAGELGIPAFKIGHYAYGIVKDGRDTFEANNEQALAMAVETEMLAAELDALATIRAIRRTFKRGEANDTTKLAQATRDLAQIRKARQATTVQTTPPRANTGVSYTAAEPANTPKSANVVDDLLSKTGAGAGSGSISRSPNSGASPAAA